MCDKGFHMACVDTPLQSVPQGERFCDGCVPGPATQTSKAKAATPAAKKKPAGKRPAAKKPAAKRGRAAKTTPAAKPQYAPPRRRTSGATGAGTRAMKQHRRRSREASGNCWRTRTSRHSYFTARSRDKPPVPDRASTAQAGSSGRTYTCDSRRNARVTWSSAIACGQRRPSALRGHGTTAAKAKMKKRSATIRIQG